MSIRKQGRYWAVLDTDGTLVCLCVYRKGAAEVVQRLQGFDVAQQWIDHNGPDTSGQDASTTSGCTLF